MPRASSQPGAESVQGTHAGVGEGLGSTVGDGVGLEVESGVGGGVGLAVGVGVVGVGGGVGFSRFSNVLKPVVVVAARVHCVNEVHCLLVNL